MTSRANLAASVLARLHNRATETGEDHQAVLTSYCLERFLYRLSVSNCHDRFVLKGAMLLRLWSDRPYRATRDLDLLRRGDGAFDAIRNDLRAIIATPVPPDAVTFDGERIEIEAIRAEDEYAGTRATLTARCGQARLSLQIANRRAALTRFRRGTLTRVVAVKPANIRHLRNEPAGQTSAPKVVNGSRRFAIGVLVEI